MYHLGYHLLDCFPYLPLACASGDNQLDVGLMPVTVAESHAIHCGLWTCSSVCFLVCV